MHWVYTVYSQQVPFSSGAWLHKVFHSNWSQFHPEFKVVTSVCYIWLNVTKTLKTFALYFPVWNSLLKLKKINKHSELPLQTNNLAAPAREDLNFELFLLKCSRNRSQIRKYWAATRSFCSERHIKCSLRKLSLYLACTERPIISYASVESSCKRHVREFHFVTPSLKMYFIFCIYFLPTCTTEIFVFTELIIFLQLKII